MTNNNFLPPEPLSISSLYNFTTKKHDTIYSKMTELSDDQLLDYIPFFPNMEGGGPARILFKVLREQGKEKIEAYAEVMEKFIGI